MLLSLQKWPQCVVGNSDVVTPDTDDPSKVTSDGDGLQGYLAHPLSAQASAP